jgi:hypothetical protein
MVDATVEALGMMDVVSAQPEGYAPPAGIGLHRATQTNGQEQHEPERTFHTHYSRIFRFIAFIPAQSYK